MTFTSLHDGFTDMLVWESISYPARWHFLAMANRASRDRRYEQPMPLQTARRCSDVPDPDACLRELHAVGLVDVDADTVTLALASDLFPPPAQRPEHLQPRKRDNKREQRRRDCEEGRHSKDCPPETCPAKRARRPTTNRADQRPGSGTGTGRGKGTGTGTGCGDVTGDATVTQTPGGAS